MFIAVHRKQFRRSVGAPGVFQRRISRSAGAKRFFRDFWFYKHFVPPGLKTERGSEETGAVDEETRRTKIKHLSATELFRDLTLDEIAEIERATVMWTVTDVLAELKVSGIIRIERRRITILDRKRLEDRAS